MTEREDYVYRAKLAEQVERYDEMVEAMKKVVQLGAPLNTEERNLLSVAYKNVIGARRSSWRIISTIEQREDSKGNSDKTELVRRFRKQFEDELKNVSTEILDLIENFLLSTAEDPDSKVFYLKMKGDYYRYMAEFSVESEKENVANESLKAYTAASQCAQAELKSTNPIRLGLALNFSVFYYEIRNKPDEACKLAKQAFDEAIAELDSLPEDSYKDSTLIMQLLRDNLTLWTSDLDTEEDRKGPDDDKA